MKYLAIRYLYDYDDGYKLISVNKFDKLEDAMSYKLVAEIDGDFTVEVYEAKEIDYSDFGKKALG